MKNDKLKLCKHCGEDNQDQFYKNNKSSCKACAIKYQKQRYQSKKEELIEYQKDYYKNNVIQSRLLAAKARAKKTRQDFNITKEFIEELIQKQEGVCIYSKRKLTLEVNNLDCVSIDRIDSLKGYTKDNVQLVTTAVNYMKAEMSEKIFLEYVHDIFVNTIV